MLRSFCWIGMILGNIIYHVSQYSVPIVSFLHFCVTSRTSEQLSQLRRQRHFYPSSLHSLGEFGWACCGHANSGCLENSRVPDNGQKQKKKTIKFSKHCPTINYCPKTLFWTTISSIIFQIYLSTINNTKTTTIQSLPWTASWPRTCHNTKPMSQYAFQLLTILKQELQ